MVLCLMGKQSLLILLIISFLLSSFPLQSQAASPTAQNGELSLKDWIPSHSNPTISLDGQWAFYWHELLTPEDIKNDTRTPVYAQVPAEWSKLSVNGQKFPNKGYATYHLTIHLNDKARNEPLALQVPSSGSAYKIWMNGQLLAQSGTVGTTKEQELAWPVSKIIYFTPSEQTIDLVVQVSNFHKRRNGMWSPFIIGNPETILLENFFYGTVLKLMFISSLLIIGVFLLFTYFFRRQNSIALLSSCSAFLLCIRLIVTDDYILLHYFPENSFALVYKLEYLTASLSMLSLVLYISKLFPNEKHRFIPKMIMLFSLGYSLFILVTPPDIFTYSIHFQFINIGLVGFYHLFYVYPLAIYHKRKWALSNFLATFFVILSLVNDWFYYMENSTSILLHYISMFIFFVIQIITVAHQLGNAHKQLEDLTNELTHVNTNLEQIVGERTKKLVEVNKELAASNEKLKNVEISRRKLLSNISHDIGTPMQSALGFVEMLSSGQIKDNQQKYLNIVHNKLLFMTRLTNDLFDLVKIDENQITYDFKEIPLQHYYESIEQQFAHDIAKHRLHFVVEPLPPVEHVQQIHLTIDEFRMNQVIQNLLQNAMKFTPPNGLIRIYATLFYEEEKIAIHIEDSGMGISADKLPHVFTRFYKVDEARSTKNGGMGLGLSISKEIITTHKGDITVTSEVNKGSTFTITLPMHFIHHEETLQSSTHTTV